MQALPGLPSATMLDLRPCTLTLSPTLAAPVLNHTPFVQWSTPQQARHRTSTHWPLPSLAQATPCHLPRDAGALPTLRPTRHDGWDGPVLWCPSAAARAGDTTGDDWHTTERLDNEQRALDLESGGSDYVLIRNKLPTAFRPVHSRPASLPYP